MNYLVFSIYDRVCGSYGELWLSTKKEIAFRKFNYLMSNSPMVSLDCDLYLIGEFDSDMGILKPLDKPEFLLRYEKVNNE